MTMAAAKTTPRLASEVLQDITLLMTSEADLAKAEMKENMREALSGLISLAAGGAVLLAGFTVVLLALAFGLVEALQWPIWLAHLVAALVGIVIGGGLLLKAKSALDPSSMAPTRTTRNLRRDADLAKGTVT